MTVPAPICFFADPDDPNFPLAPTTRFVDLTDPGLGNPGFFLITDPDFGSEDPNETWAGDADQVDLLGSDFTAKTMTLNIGVTGTSYDNEVGFVRQLAQALRWYGVMVWQPDPAGDPLYIDYFPSPLPSGIFHGQENALAEALTLLTTASGWPIAIRYNPRMRGPSTTITKINMANNLSQRAFHYVCDGSAERSYAQVTITPQSTAETDAALVQAIMAIRASGNLDEYEANQYWGVELDTASATLTLYNGTTDGHTNAEASGGAYTQTAFGTGAKPLLRRLRTVVTPSDPSALTGAYRVKLRFQPQVGPVYTFQMRWGLHDAPTPPAADFAGDILTVDCSNLDSARFMEIDLGEVTYEKDSQCLAIEIWATTDTNSSTCNWDALLFYPADISYVELYSPGLRGELDTDFYIAGTDLVTPNTTNSSSISRPAYSGSSGDAVTPAPHGTTGVFGNAPGQNSTNFTDEANGTPVQAYPIGLHRVSAGVTLQNNNQDLKTFAELRIRRFSGSGSPIDDFKIPMKTIAGQTYTTLTAVAMVDITNSTYLYQFQVVMTIARDPAYPGAARRKITHMWTKHEFIGTVSDAEASSLLLDAYAGIGWKQIGNLNVAPWSATGLIELPPGEGDIIFGFGTEPRNGMDQVDPRVPMTGAKVNPGFTVQVTILPCHTIV